MHLLRTKKKVVGRPLSGRSKLETISSPKVRSVGLRSEHSHDACTVGSRIVDVGRYFDAKSREAFCEQHLHSSQAGKLMPLRVDLDETDMRFLCSEEPRIQLQRLYLIRSRDIRGLNAPEMMIENSSRVAGYRHRQDTVFFRNNAVKQRDISQSPPFSVALEQCKSLGDGFKAPYSAVPSDQSR